MSRVPRLTRTAPRRLLLAVAALVLLLIAGTAPASGSPSGPAPGEGSRPQATGPGSIAPQPEMLFRSVAPCRVLDTRNGGGGAFGSGTSRSYYVSGTFGFAPQGGKSGGCGVPTAAESVAVVVTAVTPGGNGYVRVWRAGTSEPNATLLNYTKNQSSGIGSPVALRPDAGTDLAVKNYGGPTHLVIDVVGYYTQQMTAYINPSGTVLNQSGRLVSATRTSTGNYTLVFDRDISACTGVGSADISGRMVSVYTSGSNAYVYVYDANGAANDYYANVLITC